MKQVLLNPREFDQYGVYQALIENRAMMAGEPLELLQQRINRRYGVNFAGSRDNGRTQIYLFNFVPLGGHTMTLEERSGGRQDRLDFWSKYPPKDIEKSGPKIRGAIREIPTRRGLAYRGMSAEEWEAVQKTGMIQSAGYYNLGQEGLTLFGPDADTAQHYASGFAPWPYKPGFEVPSYVIAIPLGLTLGHRDDPENIPSDERAVRGALSTDQIVEVWRLIPETLTSGLIEVELDVSSGKVSEYGGSYPSCGWMQCEMIFSR